MSAVGVGCELSRRREKRFGLLSRLLWIAGLLAHADVACAGSARDYLNAPIDTWLTFDNFGYFTSVTPEDGLDVTSPIRTNVLARSAVITRTLGDAVK